MTRKIHLITNKPGRLAYTYIQFFKDPKLLKFEHYLMHT